MGTCRKIGVSERGLLDALHQAVNAHCAATGDTHAVIAEELGVAPSTLSAELNGTMNIRLDHIIKLLNITCGHPFGVRLARLCNAHWIPNAEPVQSAQLASVLKETGEVVSAYGAAAQDGEIDTAERLRIVQQADEAIEALEAFKLSLKPSNVQPMKGAM